MHTKSYTLRWSLALIFALALTMTRSARAQLHWDANVHGGAQKRWLDGGEGRPATVGPTLGLATHLALFPLVRAGGYVDYGTDTVAEARRHALSGGLRLKIVAPIRMQNARFWLVAGFGYGRAFVGESTRIRTNSPFTTTNEFVVPATAGGYFETPIGIGASYKYRKPWDVGVELVCRLSYGHHGAAWRDVVAVGGSERHAVPSSGLDAAAVGLVVSFGLDR
jgi:hypothetical protein